ncbi:NADPH-dependent F420 reductase [Arthrobacter sp. SAFR-044]|uniref:NADPH-dependent F420 reductase n=1 Tax=Arthrobacter sp. SAFR-044 TaxID=3387278 RepID=UPI003F7BE181
MNITVLGTGMVGRGLSARLSELGHDVAIGTRDVGQTLARTDSDSMGNPPFSDWHTAHSTIALLPFAEAGARAEVIVNATHGALSLAALEATGAENLAGKVLIDVALPLDFSEGMPPTLTVANTDSLAEQIQRAHPEARVVKMLTTVFIEVMVDPGRVPGKHNIFIAGEDADAKETARALLREFGWDEDVIVDLGGIRGARGAEMYSRLYFELVGALDTFDFNIAIVR